MGQPSTGWPCGGLPISRVARAGDPAIPADRRRRTRDHPTLVVGSGRRPGGAAGRDPSLRRPYCTDVQYARGDCDAAPGPCDAARRRPAGALVAAPGPAPAPLAGTDHPEAAMSRSLAVLLD